MKAIPLISRRVTVRESVFAEIVLWKVPEPVREADPLTNTGWRWSQRAFVSSDMTMKLAGEITGISAVKKSHISLPAWIPFWTISVTT